MQKVNEGSRNSSRKSCFYFFPGENSHQKTKKKKKKWESKKKEKPKLLLTGNQESWRWVRSEIIFQKTIYFTQRYEVFPPSVN